MRSATEKPSERQGEELAQLLGVELARTSDPRFLYRVLRALAGATPCRR